MNDFRDKWERALEIEESDGPIVQKMKALLRVDFDESLESEWPKLHLVPKEDE